MSAGTIGDSGNARMIDQDLEALGAGRRSEFGMDSLQRTPTAEIIQNPKRSGGRCHDEVIDPRGCSTCRVQ